MKSSSSPRPAPSSARKWTSVHDQFTTVELLGQGTYGVVYKAENKITKETVAMKRCRLDTYRQFGVAETALREMTLLRDLKHENIMNLQRISCNTERIYFICEYLDLDLRKYIRANPQGLSVRKVKEITYEIFKGLAFCHGHRVIHRDLKPNNVLVSADATKVKIADFGLARSMLTPGKTLTHEVVTLWYRAPELLLGHCNYGTGVDIWSGACMVLEMLTSRPLFPGDSEIDTLFRIFRLLGTPKQTQWPNKAVVPWDLFPVFKKKEDPFKSICPNLDDVGCDFLSKLFYFYPSDRPTALEVLNHSWLREIHDSYRIDKQLIPEWKTWIEEDVEKKCTSVSEPVYGTNFKHDNSFNRLLKSSVYTTSTAETEQSNEIIVLTNQENNLSNLITRCREEKNVSTIQHHRKKDDDILLKDNKSNIIDISKNKTNIDNNKSQNLTRENLTSKNYILHQDQLNLIYSREEYTKSEKKNRLLNNKITNENQSKWFATSQDVQISSKSVVEVKRPGTQRIILRDSSGDSRPTNIAYHFNHFSHGSKPIGDANQKPKYVPEHIKPDENQNNQQRISRSLKLFMGYNTNKKNQDKNKISGGLEIFNRIKRSSFGGLIDRKWKKEPEKNLLNNNEKLDLDDNLQEKQSLCSRDNKSDYITYKSPTYEAFKQSQDIVTNESKNENQGKHHTHTARQGSYRTLDCALNPHIRIGDDKDSHKKKFDLNFNQKNCQHKSTSMRKSSDPNHHNDTAEKTICTEELFKNSQSEKQTSSHPRRALSEVNGFVRNDFSLKKYTLSKSSSGIKANQYNRDKFNPCDNHNVIVDIHNNYQFDSGRYDNMKSDYITQSDMKQYRVNRESYASSDGSFGIKRKEPVRSIYGSNTHDPNTFECFRVISSALSDSYATQNFCNNMDVECSLNISDRKSRDNSRRKSSGAAFQSSYEQGRCLGVDSFSQRAIYGNDGILSFERTSERSRSYDKKSVLIRDNSPTSSHFRRKSFEKYAGISEEIFRPKYLTGVGDVPASWIRKPMQDNSNKTPDDITTSINYK